MKSILLISVFGDDKPGLVKAVSDVIKNRGGNWLESRLSHLGGKFSGLILAEFDKEHIANAEQALVELSNDSLSVTAKLTDSKPQTSLVRIQLIGNDKPGIVYEIAESLNALNANVEYLSSEVEAAPMSGGLLFKATLGVSLPEGFTFGDVKSRLEDVANDLMVDLIID